MEEEYESFSISMHDLIPLCRIVNEVVKLIGLSYDDILHTSKDGFHPKMSSSISFYGT